MKFTNNLRNFDGVSMSWFYRFSYVHSVKRRARARTLWKINWREQSLCSRVYVELRAAGGGASQPSRGDCSRGLITINYFFHRALEIATYLQTAKFEWTLASAALQSYGWLSNVTYYEYRLIKFFYTCLYLS